MLSSIVSIPLIILCFYISVVITGTVVIAIELVKHRGSWNSLKILFYCLFILQSLCRGIMIGWGLLRNIEGGEFYSNFPALLFISYSGILGLQLYQCSIKDTQSYHLLDQKLSKKRVTKQIRMGTNILIAFNTIMYAANFLLFGIAERDNGDSTTIKQNNSSNSVPIAPNDDDSIFQVKTSKIYFVIQIFYISCLGFLLIYHGLIGYKSFRRFRQYLGIKLTAGQVLFVLCILIRIVLLVFDPTSGSGSILHFQLDTREKLIFTISYFSFGEILPSLVALFIQYILPHQISKFIQDDEETDQMTDISDWGKVEIQDRIGQGASGAEVRLCNLKGATFAVKIMTDAVTFDRESFQNEIRIYKHLKKSSSILEFKGSDTSKTPNQTRLFMEYISFTLNKYIDARAICGGSCIEDSKKIFKNYLLHQNRGTKGKFPYHFQYEQCVNILYLISIAVDQIHSQKVSHGDLKTDNIFILLRETEIYQIKLGDFNQSIMNPSEKDLQNEIYSFGLIIYDVINLSNQSCIKPPKPPSLNFKQNTNILSNSNDLLLISPPPYNHENPSSNSNSNSNSNNSSRENSFKSTSSSYNNNSSNNINLNQSLLLNENEKWSPLINLYNICISNSNIFKSNDIKNYLSNLHKSNIERSGTI